jgi:hypothetical protein
VSALAISGRRGVFALRRTGDDCRHTRTDRGALVWRFSTEWRTFEKMHPSASQRNSSTSPTTSPSTPGGTGLDERVLAFAEQLGRIARAVQAKTAGWMDGDALKTELARVRDGAADLLQQLKADAPAVAENRSTGGAAIRRSRGRSGGIVDAPGKKHRAPMPIDPGANRADSQAAKMRAVKTMVKTSRHRGRG